MNQYLGLFMQAIEKPYGISIKTNDARALRQRLYSARQSHREATGNRTLDMISIWLNPDAQTTDVWLIPRRLDGECQDPQVA